MDSLIAPVDYFEVTPSSLLASVSGLLTLCFFFFFFPLFYLLIFKNELFICFYLWQLSRCCFSSVLPQFFFSLNYQLSVLSHFSGNQECPRSASWLTTRCWLWYIQELKTLSYRSMLLSHLMMYIYYCFWISVLGFLFAAPGAIRYGVTHIEILLRALCVATIWQPNTQRLLFPGKGMQADGYF